MSTATASKPPAQAKAPVKPAAPPEATAEALLDHLEATGTPRAIIQGLRDWVRKQSGVVAADTLYRYMDESGAKQGTLRKAGKFVFGETFEPESVVKLAPADEMLRLRGENDRLTDNLATLRAEKLGLTHQNAYLREQIEALTRKVSFLSIGKSKEELDALNAADKG